MEQNYVYPFIYNDFLLFILIIRIPENLYETVCHAILQTIRYVNDNRSVMYVLSLNSSPLSPTSLSLCIYIYIEHHRRYNCVYPIFDAFQCPFTLVINYICNATVPRVAEAMNARCRSLLTTTSYLTNIAEYLAPVK